jgi:hypothetical protein
MELVIHGSRIVIDSRSSDMDKESKTIRSVPVGVQYNYGGSWRPRRDYQKLVVDDLQNLRNIKDHFDKRIKLRVEDPYVQIYVEDEDTLKELTDMMNGNLKSSIRTVSWPASSKQKNILSEDKILKKTKPEYRYKFIFKDGMYTRESNQFILGYLTSLGNEVKLSNGTYRQLEVFKYICGCFFYANDEKIATFLELISPGRIKKIYELVYQPE